MSPRRRRRGCIVVVFSDEVRRRKALLVRWGVVLFHNNGNHVDKLQVIPKLLDARLRLSRATKVILPSMVHRKAKRTQSVTWQLSV
jgi:hypothetical protein